MLIFQMYTDVFIFAPNHPVWRNPYVADDRRHAYCGVVNVYSFLSDSFKFNRNADEGYLIGRLFINDENRYFVEGKGPCTVSAERFGSSEIGRETLIGLLEETLAYALEFDPYMPAAAENRRVTVDQFNTKMDNSKFVTGKRIGYDFDL